MGCARHAFPGGGIPGRGGWMRSSGYALCITHYPITHYASTNVMFIDPCVSFAIV